MRSMGWGFAAWVVFLLGFVALGATGRAAPARRASAAHVPARVKVANPITEADAAADLLQHCAADVPGALLWRTRVDSISNAATGMRHLTEAEGRNSFQHDIDDVMHGNVEGLRYEASRDREWLARPDKIDPWAGVSGKPMARFTLCARLRRIDQLNGYVAAPAGAATAKGAGTATLTGSAPPAAAPQPLPPELVQRTVLNLTHSVAERDTCIDGRFEPRANVSQSNPAYRQAYGALGTAYVGNQNERVFVVTNQCSDEIQVFAASCINYRLNKPFPGNAQVAARGMGEPTGTEVFITPYGIRLLPGSKLVIGNDGNEDPRSGGYWTQTAAITQVVYGAVSQESTRMSISNEPYFEWIHRLKALTDVRLHDRANGGPSTNGTTCNMVNFAAP